MKFTRGPYKSVSFVRTGCTATVFEADGEFAAAIGMTGWCLRVGTIVYAGHKSRREAVEAASKYFEKVSAIRPGDG